MLFCNGANEIQQTQIETALVTPAQKFLLGIMSAVGISAKFNIPIRNLERENPFLIGKFFYKLAIYEY